MKKMIMLLFWLYPLAVFPQPTGNPLVSVDWLKDHISDDNLVLFHVSEEELYREEHIPGAFYLAGSDFTVDSEDGNREYELPSVESLVSLLEEKGVDDGDIIVLYAGANWVSPTTRLYFTLDYLGYSSNTFILNGGMPLWKHEGGEVTAAIPEADRGRFTANPRPELVTTMSHVRENLQNPELQLVDARAPAFYQGVQASGGKKGHIPGARSLPYSSLYREGPNGSYLFLSADEMQTLFNEQDLRKEEPLILYCHLGQQATTVYFASRMLGYQAVLYDGSFYEWGRTDSNPIEDH